MTTVIAIGNLKGGVAKTTTCLSLGGCLAEMGKTVLLMDLDPQAHLTLSLGLKPESIRYTVSEVLLGNLSLVGASRETGTFGMDIVPANQSLSVINKVLYRQAGYEYLLKQQISALKDSLYDVILIDCPPACGPLTINAAHSRSPAGDSPSVRLLRRSFFAPDHRDGQTGPGTDQSIPGLPHSDYDVRPACPPFPSRPGAVAAAIGAPGPANGYRGGRPLKGERGSREPDHPVCPQESGRATVSPPGSRTGIRAYACCTCFQ